MSSPAPSDVFEFVPKDHSYRLNGITIPGLTRTLELTGFVDKQWFTEESRVRGTQVHKACWFLAEGDLDWNTVKPEHLPRVKRFAEFLDEVRPQLVLAETPLYSAAYNFAGTPDFVFLVNGVYWIVDVKTGRAGLAAALQTAGQKVLVEERMPQVRGARRFALELPAEGKYRLVPCPKPGDTPLLLTAVAMVHRRINENELVL